MDWLKGTLKPQHKFFEGTRIILEHTIRIILEHNRRTTDKDHSGTQMIPIRIILEHRQSFGVYLNGVGVGVAITFTRTSNYLLPQVQGRLSYGQESQANSNDHEQQS